MTTPVMPIESWNMHLYGKVPVACSSPCRMPVPHTVTFGVEPVTWLVILVVGACAFCALGFAITAWIPNSDAAAPVVNASMLPLLFLSGIFIPIGDNAPGWVTWTARIFPVKHFADGMQASYLGNAFSWVDVLVVAAWGLLGAVVALRTFSWEPRR